MKIVIVAYSCEVTSKLAKQLTLVVSICLTFAQCGLIEQPIIYSTKYICELVSEFLTIKLQWASRNDYLSQITTQLTKEQLQSLIDKEFGELFLVGDPYIPPTYL